MTVLFPMVLLAVLRFQSDRDKEPPLDPFALDSNSAAEEEFSPRSAACGEVVACLDAAGLPLCTKMPLAAEALAEGFVGGGGGLARARGCSLVTRDGERARQGNTAMQLPCSCHAVASQ